MSININVPGGSALVLDHLVLDVNGTITNRGVLIPGVAARIARLRETFDVHLLTADTYGTADEISAALDVPAERVTDGVAKVAALQRLGGDSCVAIGNGANDELMLRTVGLGIAVLGPEGASPRTLAAADLVCGSILTALDLLTEPRALTSTLRH
jgi:soluble P-type ATPase